MATNIVRGGTCRLIFRPQNGLDVEDLGVPKIGIAQEGVFLAPEVTVDVEHNMIYADLSERETMQLIENVETKVQAAYTNETTGEVYRFPIHIVTVSETIFDTFHDEYEEVTPNEGDNPSEKRWYEEDPNNEGEFYLTLDATVNANKTYYVLL